MSVCSKRARRSSSLPVPQSCQVHRFDTGEPNVSVSGPPKPLGAATSSSTGHSTHSSTVANGRPLLQGRNWRSFCVRFCFCNDSRAPACDTLSTFEKQHCELARVVQVEGLIGLAGDLEAEAFTHDAVERLAVLAVHLLFHDFAGKLNSTTISLFLISIGYSF